MVEEEFSSSIVYSKMTTDRIKSSKNYKNGGQRQVHVRGSTCFQIRIMLF